MDQSLQSNGEPIAPSPLPPRRRLGGAVYVPTLTAPRPETLANPAPADSTMPRTTTSPRRHHHHRRHRRPWFRRPLVVLPLVGLLLLAGGASVVLYRATATIATLHTASTPPPVVHVAPDASDAQPGSDPTQASGPAVAIETGPARAAVATATGNHDQQGGGIFGSVSQAASNVSSLAHGAAVAAGITSGSSAALNILVMGVDARPGEPIDIAVRPDALMVLHLDPAAKTCRLLSVPRDTRTELPGYGLSKVNHALMVGGIPYERLVVGQLLGLTIDHYVVIDFTGFKALVDAVGGVTVTVPASFSMDGLTFHPGPQTLTGTQALAFARYRGGPDRDLGRIRDQQQVLHGLLTRAQGRDIVADVNQLLPALAAHLRTDLAPAQIVSLAQQYRSVCTAGRLQLSELQGSVAQYPDPLFKKPLYYLVVSPTEIQDKVAKLTAP